MRQFLRKVRVSFSGSGGFIVNPSSRVEVRELRVAFNVAKSISGSPNKFKVMIWNLNADHRNSIGKELDDVKIEAGYVPPEGGGNLGVIAFGSVRDVQHERSNADIITTVTCGDGDPAFRQATVSETHPAGVTIPDLVESLFQRLSNFEIVKGEWLFPENVRTTKRPVSMCGGAVRELNNLGRGNGFYWSIQNKVMEVIPTDGHLPGQVLISAQSGMIGSPTITDNGVKVRCLLNPGIRPNRTVKVQSDVLDMNAQDGTYRVSKLDMIGDNMNGDFVSVVHGESVADGKVDEGVLK